ncbi:MAG: DUF711 domain-containing protein [Acidobacteria bacterium]|nr:MAG: DUF711 domain-containing protein [Acidobacteriota bacterium]
MHSRFQAFTLLMLAASSPVLGAEQYRQPKIRAITAFVRIDGSQSLQPVQDALPFLRRAKDTFEKAGYQVQTIRITTQPFVQYSGGRSTKENLAFFKSLDQLAEKESFLFNIGPLTLNTSSDLGNVELLTQVLPPTWANATVVVADENGVRWNAIQAAAQIIKYLEDHSRNGTSNFNFAAVAMVPPDTPFFPGSNHDGPGRQFSVGWEAGNFVTDVLKEAKRDWPRAKTSLSEAFEQQGRFVDVIATQLEKDSGWKYMGLDPTPAPNSDSSIGAAIEELTGAKFGSSGTLSAAALITEAERSITAKRVGYSGLMLPVLEDPVLAQRWAEGTYDLDSLLAYSAVCGTGLDAIPLPGEVSQEQLERIIGDMASLAFKWKKPLTARLIPAPGKRAGDRTDFSFGVAQFPNTTLRTLP